VTRSHIKVRDAHQRIHDSRARIQLRRECIARRWRNFTSTFLSSKQEEKALEDPNFYLTDGTVTMILAPCKIEDYLGTEHKRPSKTTSKCWRRPILNISLQRLRMSSLNTK